ncbi:MAG: hypothetical protein Q8P10_03160 [bacterium]|nr:hypothetical protein [bacterium]
MSKHKTKQQKIISNLRRQLQLKNSATQSEPLQKVNHIDTQVVQKNENLNKAFSYSPNKSFAKTTTVSYNYLPHDLLKTAILTGSILTLELILFFLSKNHILPFAL